MLFSAEQTRSASSKTSLSLPQALRSKLTDAIKAATVTVKTEKLDFIERSPVGNRNSTAQWRRAIARSHKESEIPAYSPRWALARTG